MVVAIVVSMSGLLVGFGKSVHRAPRVGGYAQMDRHGKAANPFGTA